MMELESMNEEKRCKAQKKVNVDISIPGLGRLLNPAYGKNKKIMWLFIVIVCAIACMYLTIDRLVHYFKIPVATKVEVNRLDYITFPPFTLCSTNLIQGLKTLVREKVRQECISRQLANCSDKEALANLAFRELNFTVMDIWETHILKDIEVLSVEMNQPINVANYWLNNETSDKFFFSRQRTLLGSCIYVKHIGRIPYLSTATSITLRITEHRIIENMDMSYMLIPHGEEDVKDLTSYEFLSNEFEAIPAGYYVQVKLHTEDFTLKNYSHKVCYDKVEELGRLKQCALNFLRFNYCRYPYLPDTFRECESLKDLAEPTESQLFAQLEKISDNCSVRPLCQDVQHQITIDYLRHANRLARNQTLIIVKMADDTIDIVKQYYVYTFPDLVSDLFAYWGFFLNLSALVFVEIFESLYQKTCAALVRSKRKTQKS